MLNNNKNSAEALKNNPQRVIKALRGAIKDDPLWGQIYDEIVIYLEKELGSFKAAIRFLNEVRKSYWTVSDECRQNAMAVHSGSWQCNNKLHA